MRTVRGKVPGARQCVHSAERCSRRRDGLCLFPGPSASVPAADGSTDSGVPLRRFAHGHVVAGARGPVQIYSRMTAVKALGFSIRALWEIFVFDFGYLYPKVFAKIKYLLFDYWRLECV